MCRPRYWGVYPGGTVRVGYRAGQADFGVEALALYVDTLSSAPWSAWFRVAKGVRGSAAVAW